MNNSPTVRKTLIALFLSSLSAMSLGNPLPTQAQDAAPQHIGDTASERTDRLIIRYRTNARAARGAGLNADEVRDLSDDAGEPIIFEREMDDGAVVVRLRDFKKLGDARALAARLANRSDIEYVEPDQILYPVLVPNDPSYTQQWHYASPSSGRYGANLPGAWDITTGSPSLVVAVIDTGITNHADLAGRTVAGYDFISDSRIGNDGNARDADASDAGDWITSAEAASGFFAGCPVGNSSWHGTHVAGTIGALSNNGSGVAGINWQSKIQPVRVLGKCGGYTSDIADGIRWAAGLAVSGAPTNPTPARVINMSLGGSGACGTTTQSAITAATNAGTIVIVAAGNSNADASGFNPANCVNVITVASTGPTGNKAYYSNYGATVEIAAPGGDKQVSSTDGGVLSTLNAGTTVPAGDTYAWYQGTSMATPHVVGIVSLMKSLNPNLTTAQAIQLLQSTVTPFPAGSTCTPALCGPGIINAAGAVAATQAAINQPPGAFGKSAPANGATNQATNLTLSWGASTNASSYQYCVDTVNDSACNTTWTSTGTATSANVTGLASNTTYYWQVRAVNSLGSVEANGAGAWWSFTTQVLPAPGAFGKSSPTNGRNNRPVNGLVLSWGSSSNAASYEYCVDTVNDNACNGAWVNVSTATSATLNGLARRTVYYWQVRAVNASGATLANSGTWWNFRTQ